MLHLTRAHPLGDLLYGLFQSLCCFCGPARQSSLRDLAATQIAEGLTRALAGHQLILLQIHRQGSYPRSILSRSTYLDRKARTTHLLTVNTGHLLDLMLTHHQAHRGEIIHLSSLDYFSCDPFQRLVTMGTLLRAVLHDPIRLLHHLQRLPRMTRLSTTPLLTWVSPRVPL